MGILGTVPDLNSLSDVMIVDPIQNNLFAYNSITAMWENKTAAELDIGVDDLFDVTISDPQSGQVIMYDGSIWKNEYTNKADRPYLYFISSFV
jgi:hypothetical protein